ncbi:helix-turn-helix transcriptional regulator [Ruegeria sp.]|uniref:helix-turn-helix transcriptional regulator n=1 Tax=Ruegeria sp. TaxID=1879320 RepID=UPI003AFF68AD
MSISSINSTWLTTAQAAARIGIARGSLGRLVRQGRGPRVHKISERTWRFRVSDVEAWINNRAYESADPEDRQ